MIVLKECENFFGEQDDRINCYLIYDPWKNDRDLKKFIRVRLNDNRPIITRRRYDELWENFKLGYQMGAYHSNWIHNILTRLFNEECKKPVKYL